MPHPYISHKTIPIAKSINFTYEISFDILDFQTLSKWDTNAIVGRLPAISPKMSIEVSFFHKRINKWIVKIVNLYKISRLQIFKKHW